MPIRASLRARRRTSSSRRKNGWPTSAQRWKNYGPSSNGWKRRPADAPVSISARHGLHELFESLVEEIRPSIRLERLFKRSTIAHRRSGSDWTNPRPWQKLSRQPIDIPVTALSRTVRIAKVHSNARCPGQLLAPGHLFSPDCKSTSGARDEQIRLSLAANAVPNALGAGLRRHRQPTARPAKKGSFTTTTTATAACLHTYFAVSDHRLHTCGPPQAADAAAAGADANPLPLR